MLLLVVLSFLGVLPVQGLASDNPYVERIETTVVDGWLNVDADVHLPISDDLRFFAERGVTLYFTADLEIVRPRRWWFDSEVINTQQTWRVVYSNAHPAMAHRLRRFIAARSVAGRRAISASPYSRLGGITRYGSGSRRNLCGAVACPAGYIAACAALPRRCPQ